MTDRMTAAFEAPPVWPALLRAASSPYRDAGRFAWRFAHGKLGFDPVFRHLLAHGLIAPHARVLDIGCGQGLLASLLRQCAVLQRDGRWPGGWAAAPVGAHVVGIELMACEVARARTALGDDATFVCGDMRHTPFPPADTVVLLDVLHYVGIGDQDAILTRVRQSLPLGGRLLLRVGDAGARRAFAFGRCVDAVVAFMRRRRAVPQFGRTLPAWRDQLESLGFTVTQQPMSRGTPFANVLLVAEVTGPVMGRVMGRVARPSSSPARANAPAFPVFPASPASSGSPASSASPSTTRAAQ